MLKVEELTVELGGRTVLQDVSLAFGTGQITAIVGPNGAGKSTLLGALAGDIVPDHGTAVFDGQNLAQLTPMALANRRAVLPQSTSISFPFTVYELVRLGVIDSASREDSSARVIKALNDVDLAGFGGRFIQQLSGGERQRAHFARILCQAPQACSPDGPRYLLLDEPTASLDLRHQTDFLKLVRRFADSGGGVIVILHDLNLASLWADRLVVLKAGRVVADGAPSDLIDPDVMEPVFETRLQMLRNAAGQALIFPCN